MKTDISSAYLTGTATAYGARTRLRGLYVNGTGTITFRDGGASGTIKLQLNTTGAHSVLIPEDGILFSTDLHATISGLTAVTVFYG